MQIQHPFIMKKKNPQQIEYRRKVPNIIKAVSDRTTAHIVLNFRKLKAFSLKYETRQVYTLYTPLKLKTAIKKSVKIL